MVKEKLIELVVDLLGGKVGTMGVALLGGLRLLGNVTVIDQPLIKIGWYTIIATLIGNSFVLVVNKLIDMHRYYFIEYRTAKNKMRSEEKKANEHQGEDK